MTLQKRYIRGTDRFFFLTELEVPEPEISPEVAHHIMVVDRSGSMYYDIDKLKQSLEQALAVDTATGNPETLTTLISFSSHGDVICHWADVSVKDVMDLNNAHISELRGIRATALTGISQGLNEALKHVTEGQTTGITLFTDGYANHPSPSSENKAMDDFVKRARQIPGLFLNCVGYRDWCDWPRMKAMSNDLSGTTIKATSFAEVFGVLRDTQALLEGGVRPVVTLPALAGAYTLLINKTTGQVNVSGVGEAMRLSGLSGEDEVEAWSVWSEESKARAPRGWKAFPKDEMWRQGALVSALVTKLDLSPAKDLLFRSGNKTLWEEHQAAVTPSSLAALQEDLAVWVRVQANTMYKMGRNTKPKYNIFDLANAFNAAPPNSVALDSEKFFKTYRRRSEKKVMGSRGADGSIVPPNAVSESGTPFIRGMSFNRSEATVQLETIASLQLKDLDGNSIREVAKVPLASLSEFRSYTLFSSGERNVDEIPLEITSKQGVGVVAPFLTPAKAKKLKVGSKVKIELKKFSLAGAGSMGVHMLEGVVRELRYAEAALKFFSAARNKKATSDYSPEQVLALREYHLSPALYFSPPTTALFPDREAAISHGHIDSYTRYKVNYGAIDILNGGAFRTGNAFLDRWFEVRIKGELVKKPKLLETYYNPDAEFVVKANRRGGDTPADLLMAKIFIPLLESKDKFNVDDIEDRFLRYSSAVERHYSSLQSLTLQVGCTGLLPRHLADGMDRFEPDDFAEHFNVKLKKAEKEGIFYVCAAADNDFTISIVPSTAWYTTDAGLAAN